MSENKPATQPGWIDPGDVPELDEAFFDRATLFQGQKQLRRGRPPLPVQRPTLNMRIDVEVLAAFKATGPGWQTRINALLREAVEQGRVKAELNGTGS
jgi:uncharacterized protein (DUF4415 family)